MNSKTFQLLFAVLLALSFASCQKERPVYACDPPLNDWAVQHRESNQNITRGELASILSVDTQMAVYHSLSSANKYNIWKSKMEIVKRDSSLSNSEKQHIQNAIDYIQPDSWEDDQSLATLEAWAGNWGQYAAEHLGWDSTKLFLIAETWLMEPEMQQIKDHYASRPPNNPEVSACNCRYTISCFWSVESCNRGKCTRQGGCGLFGSSTCTGTCGL